MIPSAPFGSTGHQSRRTLFGAAALGKVTQAEADRALELVLRYDLNHLDTAASYGDSELHIAPWLKREGRDRFFLATKTGKRTYAEARNEIRLSLRRLGVDHVDLIQLHNLVDQRDIDLCVRFVLARPGLFLNTASDIDLLAKILDAADRAGAAPTSEEMEDLMRRREMAPLFA